MSKVIIIGVGGVGSVVAHKCAQHPEVFTDIVLASRTQAKCDALAKAIGAPNIVTDRVDADSVDELVALFERHRPDMVINVALPYQDLAIMEACLRTGVNYLDTANYEPPWTPRRGSLRVFMAVGLPRALREGRTHRYPRLRFRPGRVGRFHGICRQALVLGDGISRHRRLQRR